MSYKTLLGSLLILHKSNLIQPSITFAGKARQQSLANKSYTRVEMTNSDSAFCTHKIIIIH